MNKASPNSNKKFKRKILLVDRDFQYKYTINACLFVGALLLFFGGMILFFHKYNYQMLIDESIVRLPEIKSTLVKEFNFITFLMLGFLILAEILIFCFGIYFSHRIAGPVFALKRELIKFAKGESGVRLNLRRKDELHSLKNIFNLAMERNDQRYIEVKRVLTQTAQELDEHSPQKKKILSLVNKL